MDVLDVHEPQCTPRVVLVAAALGPVGFGIHRWAGVQDHQFGGVRIRSDDHLNVPGMCAYYSQLIINIIQIINAYQSYFKSIFYLNLN